MASVFSSRARAKPPAAPGSWWPWAGGQPTPARRRHDPLPLLGARPAPNPAARSPWSLDIESARLPRTAREVDRDLLVVGRGAECDVQLPDQRVSRRHLRVARGGDGLWAEDLGSRGGTRLNGRPLAEVARLADRDLLELTDDSRIVVCSGAAAMATAPSPATTGSTLLRDAASMLMRRADLETSSSAEELRRYAERLHLINEVHQALTESPSRGALLEMILDRVFRSLRPEQAALLLLDKAGNVTEVVSRPPGLGPDRVLFSRSLLRALKERRHAAPGPRP